ncbi:hypothetical protein SAMN05443377_11763 [Propionibacterium cyclohexanicum]|uniref:Phospholipid-binding protein, PBP family n=1 Tax=Propionibacterium cyclohexanicum TaxID=64702 RepID=A0A1H9T277_9ACTN|nr:YbhB/YbcL family Raf kinase inhibitor-like protein [Propionibacterium cyclohexanicum]SER90713.1 hypothetical protein SAMN05443377_11763 [Propionibacterium cyclohexanicum]
MQLRSDDLGEGEEIPLVHAEPRAGGKNLVPHLAWSDLPPDTKSLAVTVWDPDAPMEGGFWHWLALDIPVGTHGVEHGGALPPQTREVNNGYGYARYGGPCPPHGQRHRYIFTLWALDVGHLPVPEGSGPEEVERLLAAHQLDSATLTPVFTSTL